MSLTQIPVLQARQLYTQMRNWVLVAAKLQETTGRSWSADTVRKAALRETSLTTRHPTSPWDDKSIEALKRYHGLCYSASDMAAALVKEFGRKFTRNAVIGKLARFGLRAQGRQPTGGHDARKKNGETRPRIRKPKLIEAPPMALDTRPLRDETEPHIIPLGQRCSILELTEGKCHWPIGDPRDKDSFFFCGARTIEGLPYCGHHSRIAYQPAGERRRKEEAA